MAVARGTPLRGGTYLERPEGHGGRALYQAAINRMGRATLGALQSVVAESKLARQDHSSAIDGLGLHSGS